MENVDIVLYHGGCMDGFFGAYACYLKHKNVKYVPMYYHVHIKEDVFSDLLNKCVDKNVVMVDFSLPYNLIMRLIEKCKEFIVLDHHNTALKELEKVPDKNKIFDMKRSGATISYNYFFHDKKVPLSFLYVEDYDLWKWTMKEQSEPFTTALYNKMCISEKSDLDEGNHSKKFEELHNLIHTQSKMKKIIEIGMHYLDYRNRMISDIVKKYKKVRIIKQINNKVNGYVGALVNSNVFPSEIGNILSSQDKIDFAIVYKHGFDSDDNNKHKMFCYCSIRSNSDECDVSEIAKHFGGGGHIRASGFMLEGDLSTYFEIIK